MDQPGVEVETAALVRDVPPQFAHRRVPRAGGQADEDEPAEHPPCLDGLGSTQHAPGDDVAVLVRHGLRLPAVGRVLSDPATDRPIDAVDLGWAEPARAAGARLGQVDLGVPGQRVLVGIQVDGLLELVEVFAGTGLFRQRCVGVPRLVAGVRQGHPPLDVRLALRRRDVLEGVVAEELGQGGKTGTPHEVDVLGALDRLTPAVRPRNSDGSVGFQQVGERGGDRHHPRRDDAAGFGPFLQLVQVEEGVGVPAPVWTQAGRDLPPAVPDVQRDAAAFPRPPFGASFDKVGLHRRRAPLPLHLRDDRGSGHQRDANVLGGAPDGARLHRLLHDSRVLHPVPARVRAFRKADAGRIFRQVERAPCPPLTVPPPYQGERRISWLPFADASGRGPTSSPLQASPRTGAEAN